MLKIAIADDQIESAEKEETIVKEVYRTQGQECQTEIFTDSEKLLFKIREAYFYDIYLLDIEMPGIDGKSLAKEINKNFEHPIIIFITSHREYALEGYELGIYRYIDKILLEEKLSRALNNAAEDIKKNANSYYTIESATRSTKIFLKDIIYMRKQEKNTIFVTSKGENRERKKLAEVFQTVKLSDFIYINRGNVVNINHITDLRGVVLIMSNGDKLTVSRSRLEDVKRKTNAFWKENSKL